MGEFAIIKLMNTWLKPLITFAVGIILGVGGMYLVGVRPSIGPTGSGEISSIPGFADVNFNLIKDNSVVTHADVFVTLRGVIREIKDNTITIVNGNSKPITLILNEDGPIFVKPTQQGNQLSAPQQITFQDLKVNNVINVFGQLYGDKVIVESVLLETFPPPPAQ